jgi:DNA-binding MarR family transcriptional regulator
MTRTKRSGANGHTQAGQGPDDMATDARLQILEEELLTLLRQVRRAAVARDRRIHPEFQLAGYAVLLWLAAHDGARSADVVNALDMDKGAVSRQIDHLERLHW